MCANSIMEAFALKYSVLIVEDDKTVNELIADFFQNADFLTTQVYTGTDALCAVEESSFDVILLDVMMPGADGFTVCKQIRQKNDTPIIFITARESEEDKLQGFSLGADDYITKPFSYSVLVAKAENLIKRSKGNVIGNNIISACGIVLNTVSRSVTVDGEPVELRPKEYEFLYYLMTNKNKAIPKEKLIIDLWGYDFEGDERAPDKQITNLRKKLGNKANCIKTVFKVGYMFEEK